jgi:hypothetical protein
MVKDGKRHLGKDAPVRAGISGTAKARIALIKFNGGSDQFPASQHLNRSARTIHELGGKS